MLRVFAWPILFCLEGSNCRESTFFQFFSSIKKWSSQPFFADFSPGARCSIQNRLTFKSMPNTTFKVLIFRTTPNIFVGSSWYIRFWVLVILTPCRYSKSTDTPWWWISGGNLGLEAILCNKDQNKFGQAKMCKICSYYLSKMRYCAETEIFCDYFCWTKIVVYSLHSSETCVVTE